MRHPTPADEICPNSKRVPYSKAHSFLFDGDDPYVVCSWCGQRRGTTHGMIYEDTPIPRARGAYEYMHPESTPSVKEVVEECTLHLMECKVTGDEDLEHEIRTTLTRYAEAIRAEAIANYQTNDEQKHIASAVEVARREEREKGQHVINLILPLAKGYAHQHDVGANQRYVDIAESYLTPPTDNPKSV